MQPWAEADGTPCLRQHRVRTLRVLGGVHTHRIHPGSFAWWGEKASLAKMVLAKLQNSQISIRESSQRKSQEPARCQARMEMLSRAPAQPTTSPRASTVRGSGSNGVEIPHPGHRSLGCTFVKLCSLWLWAEQEILVPHSRQESRDRMHRNTATSFASSLTQISSLFWEVIPTTFCCLFKPRFPSSQTSPCALPALWLERQRSRCPAATAHQLLGRTDRSPPGGWKG